MPAPRIYVQPHQAGTLTLEEKLSLSIQHSEKYMGPELWQQVKGFFSPLSLGIMGLTVAGWAVGHFFGVSEIVDAVLLVSGGVMLGASAVDIAKDLMDFALGTYNAKGDGPELGEAGKHFAHAVVAGGVTVISALLLFKFNGMRKNPIMRGRRPEIAPMYEQRGPGELFYKAKNQQSGPRMYREKRMDATVRGYTTAWGDIWINSALSEAEKLATFYHEQWHSFWTPKLWYLRDIRVELAARSEAGSYLLKYLSEAGAEGYSLMRTRGNVVDALSFPMKSGTGGVAYVTVAGMKTEAMGFFVGPVDVGAMPYRVYVSYTRPRGMKPVNMDKGKHNP